MAEVKKICPACGKRVMRMDSRSCRECWLGLARVRREMRESLAMVNRIKRAMRKQGLR